jgi:hypothetical protein
MTKTIVTIALLLIPVSLFAGTFISDDFESGTTCIGSTDACPDWSWQDVWTPASGTGLYYGTGDLYELSTDQAYRGSYSLRLNLAGRNNFCNVNINSCTDLVHNGNNLTYFVDNGGSNLDTNYDIGDLLYNKTKYMEKWTITGFSNNAATNDQADTSGSSDAGPIHGQSGGDIDTSDDVKICEDGGAERRSDCNNAIGYFDNISTADFPAGGSLFKAMYIYIPSATTMPDTTLKLTYFHDSNGDSIAPRIQCGVGERQYEFETGGDDVAWENSDIQITFDEWWYVEMEVKNETSSGANDGEFRFWACRSIENPGNPIIEQTSLDIDSIRVSDGMSLMGNIQHDNTISGYIYIDDVKVADSRIGHQSSSADLGVQYTGVTRQ